ncbi:MAG TPA: 23S rRNA (adenine(2503)-C(2))-methyltransferase RlmN [Bacteroidales bacterium]|nr:MAG: 23S rRNA (adenine(2503)-C(2))-methyltransferase [Bacteroidetes bacterium GWF2_33_38]OFY76050.1 MAG: 23S rRNA (adenine(2503)-C(2))-methyltransferase [Bacteroidetes bacterium RIFOXYA12_FULL_33_9]OFY91256.1 MAG: 23S rRNA (adenine(2503)-C(2))-methyltransferase [Bacteroidetes bacterium RIFOXYA2_FULL_33_7]HBF87933.1 23S rRNA (adenine(2503)-C(2))-methyltransferase RlmN [Bacteroidales bacterium]
MIEENENKKIDIRALEKDELFMKIDEIGEKTFRAKQIYSWLWEKGVESFEEMTNLSKPLREKLDEVFYMDKLDVKAKQRSKDGSIKVAFQLSDGRLVEGVLIPSTDRVTACISSQTGCKLGCTFCATGRISDLRNLTIGEIFTQVTMLNKMSEQEYGRKLANLVFMGMGEPLLNYENVVTAINRISSEDGMNFSASRITVSTIGISKFIKKLADDNVRFNLAISLHTANEEKRNRLMPYSLSDGLKNISEAIKYFHAKTGARITYEYILFKDFNDSLQDAKDFASFCKISPCKINIIEYNSVQGSGFEKSNPVKSKAFIDYMKNCNLIVNVRKSKGGDIDAACGQLANK